VAGGTGTILNDDVRAPAAIVYVDDNWAAVPNGQDPDAQLCGLANFETALSRDQLKKLYKNPKDYYNKVAQRYDQLVKEGWALPVYRDMVLAEAARVTF